MSASRKKPPREEARLTDLSALAPGAERAVQNALITECLADRHFRVVARAATLAAQRGLSELVPQLLAAYPRFLEEPRKRDPQCIAKQAIVQALVELDARDVDFFLSGIRYVQLEPASPPIDSAIHVRSGCAMGLVATGYSRAIQELTALLTDPVWRVRAGAARAIACGRPGEAEAVLRLKVQVGDPEPEVLGECFTGLLGVAQDEGVTFVANYLSSHRDGVQDYAALALGESRQPTALAHLRAAWEASPRIGSFRAVLIRAAGLHRSPAAVDWLVEMIERGAQADADVAVEVLSVYERDSRLRERVEVALGRRRAHSSPPPGDRRG
jgi:HEAT repeat protein